MPTVATKTKARKPAQTVAGTCRLTLTVNGTAYTLTPLPADPALARRVWRLRKEDGTAYDAHADPDGRGHGCTCAHWTYRLEGTDGEAARKGCKHVAALRACGLLA